MQPIAALTVVYGRLSTKKGIDKVESIQLRVVQCHEQLFQRNKHNYLFSIIISEESTIKISVKKSNKEKQQISLPLARPRTGHTAMTVVALQWLHENNIEIGCV